MSSFLIDTLIWTGALIALVLVLRRPVARWFGPQAAYALWLLPLLRLAMPPLVLPAWLRPEAAGAGAEAGAGEAALTLEITTAPAPRLLERAAQTPEALPSPIDFITPLLAIWLAGAAIVLLHRIVLYRRMRRELLEQARAVGEAGNIRLVESPATDGPVAFGVFDKVVALPDGFMSGLDRQTRDLAIAHELAHHRGHDLLANMLVQPLFALHWFTPLGWVGWRALRSDQEAACDARVIAARPQSEHAAYAGVIARFAAQTSAPPRRVLAAPMACPVLGDKSIIHRLRSLTMSPMSPRRRLSGRILLAGAALALPLTASISWAAAESQPGPPAAPLPPEAPAPPEAPPPPEAPLPPDLSAAEAAMDQADRALEAADAALGDMQGGERRYVYSRRIEREEETSRTERRVERRFDREMTAEERAHFEADMAQMRRDLHEQLGENAEWRRELRIAVQEAQNVDVPEVVVSCRGAGDQPVSTSENEAGKTRIMICEAAIERMAMSAVRSAREAIAKSPGLSPEERAEALRSIDEEIANLGNEG